MSDVTLAKYHQLGNNFRRIRGETWKKKEFQHNNIRVSLYNNQYVTNLTYVYPFTHSKLSIKLQWVYPNTLTLSSSMASLNELK